LIKWVLIRDEIEFQIDHDPEVENWQTQRPTLGKDTEEEQYDPG